MIWIFLRGACAFPNIWILPSYLGQSLVPRARVVRRAVREEQVDDSAQDGEKEDEQAPEKLVQGGSVGLDDFDYMFYNKTC